MADDSAILQQPKKRKPGPAELAATAVGISPRLLYYCKKVHDRGIPELIAACAAGTISVSRAAKIADYPHDQQAALMAAPRRNRDDDSVITHVRSGANRLISALDADDCDRILSAVDELQQWLELIREAVKVVQNGEEQPP